VAAPRAAARRILASLSGAAVLAATVTACSSAPSAAPVAPAASSGGQTVVTISGGVCGRGWAHPHTGLQTFQLHNTSSGVAEVYLINPLEGSIDPDSASAPVFAEVEDIGPGTTAPMQVNVGSGAYAFDCDVQHYGTTIGPIVRIPGAAHGTPGVLSVTFNDLIGSPGNPLAPASQYLAYVASGVTQLVRQTAVLAADVHAGDLSAARRAWLTAHLTYERLGAAYGTFGHFDTEIDGRADGLAGGVRSPHFTGFYRVEYGLWHGQPQAAVAGPADQLRHDAVELHAALPHLQLILSDLGLRTHEILENALQFQLTGHDDYGSGTTLATTAANIAGTVELLKVLHPLLVTRDRVLPQTYFWLDRLQRLVMAARHPNGAWTPAGQLGTSRREQIDAAAGQALELLASVATIFEAEKQL
jgi:iron uptake system component EfeO